MFWLLYATDAGASGKEFVEVAVQDEGGNPDAATVSSHHLDMVREETGDFSNAYDLEDEESWVGILAVPNKHLMFP